MFGLRPRREETSNSLGRSRIAPKNRTRGEIGE